MVGNYALEIGCVDMIVDIGASTQALYDLCIRYPAQENAVTTKTIHENFTR